MAKSKIKPKYRLFTPGPVDVPDFVLTDVGAPLIYHREDSFTKLYASVRQGLQKVMATANEVYVLTCSGTGAMEAAVANLVLPGEKVLVASAGKFGERWRELAIRYGGYVDALTQTYGEPISPLELERHLRATESVRCVFATLTETSTGAVHDIKAFGEVCRRLNRILVVDAVAGLGADEMHADKWHVDVVVGGSQKALAVPPGLGFISVSERAWQLVNRHRGTRFYFDLKAYRRFWETKGQTPWTPAISLFYGLDAALKRATRGGVAGYWRKHRQMAEHVRKHVAKLGLELFPARPSNALTVIRMPEGVDGTKVVELCKKDGFLFANGQADMRGKIVRIGHMGPVSRAAMDTALACFKRHYTAVAKSAPKPARPD